MRVTAIGVLLAACANASFAQEQVGAVEGVVRDATGARVAGASVEVSGSALLRTAQAATDALGTYRFPALPSGRYQAKALRDGFRVALSPEFHLAVGQLLRVDFTLVPGDRSESVEVVGDPPLIDLRQSASFTTLSGPFLHGLPRGRDAESVALLAASAFHEPKLAGVSIDGASGADNRWYVDGLETTSLRLGRPGKRLVTDFVEELQVKSSGYDAEFGGAIGGVVSVVTRTGSERWRGEVGTYLSGDQLDARPRPVVRIDPLDNTRMLRQREPESDYTTWEPGLALSGPVLRERLWIYAAYLPDLRTHRQTVTFLSTGETRRFSSTLRTHHAALTTTAQLGPRVRARAGLQMSSLFRDGILPSPDGSGNPDHPYRNFDLRQPNVSVSGSVDVLASSRVHVGVRGGYFRSDESDSGNPAVVRHSFDRTNVGMPGVPPELQRPRDFATVPTNNATVRDVQARAALHADATWYRGRHALKAGVQLDRIGNDVFRGTQKPVVRLYWGEGAATTDGRLVRGTYGYYRAFYSGTFGDVSADLVALFAQDRVTLWRDRLTLSLGLRVEREEIPSYRRDAGLAENAIEFGFLDRVAPRLGFAWDARGDGRLKVYGSFGLFYDTTKLELGRVLFGGGQFLDHFFTLDTVDWPSIGADPACPPRCPGTLIEVIDRRIPSNDPRDFRVDPDLRPMRSREVVLGVQRQLGAESSVGVRYVRKRLDRAVEDQGVIVPGVGEKYYITNPGFGIGRYLLGPEFPAQPKARRAYDALEVELWRRPTRGWALHASYLLSRLHGNYSGLASSDEGGRVSPNINRVFDSLAMSFDEEGRPSDGLLPTDRPHRLKAQLVRNFSFGTLVGVSAIAQSGTPVSRILDLGGSIPVYYRGRGSDGRTPITSRLDLYIQHEVALGGARRLQLSANVVNLFDQAGVTEIQGRELQAELALTSEDYLRGGADVEALVGEQGRLRDPRFLQATVFQEPRAMRLGVKLLF